MTNGFVPATARQAAPTAPVGPAEKSYCPAGVTRWPPTVLPAATCNVQRWVGW